MLRLRPSAYLKSHLATSALHNLGGAGGIQLGLLVSGTLSARLLGPSGRGYLAILVAIPSAIGQIGAVGMSLAATYYLSAGLVDGAALIHLLRRPVLLQVLLLTAINSTVVLGYTFISGAPILLAACISLVFIQAALLLDYGLAFLLGARHHGTVNLIRILSTGLGAIFIVPLYILHDRSLPAFVAASVVGSLIAGVIALQRGVAAALTIKVSNCLVGQVGRQRAKRTVLAFGRDGYIGYLSPVDSFRLDQLAVGFLLSPRELGFYVVGAAFTNIGRMVAKNLGLSATAEIASQTDPEAQRRAVRHTLLLTGGIITSLTVALAVFVIPAIPLFFGNRYRASIPVAEILLVAYWLLALKRVVVDVMRGIGETRAGTRAEILNLALFVAGVVPLGLWLGGKGVALALVLAAAGGSVLLVTNVVRIMRGLHAETPTEGQHLGLGLSRPVEN